jgi:micrococcal nuclease
MTSPRVDRVLPVRVRRSLAMLVCALALGACADGGPAAGAPSGSAGTRPPGPPPSTAVSTPPDDAPVPAPGERTNAYVTSVTDGDTIRVRSRGRTLDVRLIGIDTPESVAPGAPVQCFARAAARFTTRELEGERVRLEFDLERRDRYGRTLAYVWRGEELFNETLVREGYAFVTTYPPNVRYEDVFLAAQREARAAERGVWGRCVDEGAQEECDPAYPDVCIPPPPPDLDCADIDERRFAVRPPDPHAFDGDGNGIGCESA